ncbi:STAS domain-containing protein [candidate division NPL-UPA2 bacterium]|nr:STAS domain-containing protein [candidate division NPL-UPA2 bacterium]
MKVLLSCSHVKCFAFHKKAGGKEAAVIGCEISTRTFDLGEKIVQVVDVSGFLDAHTSPQLEKTLSSLVEGGNYSLILDLKGLDYINSASLGLLMGIAKRVRAKGGDLKLVNLSEKINKILTILGFSKVLKVFDQTKEALASFK